MRIKIDSTLNIDYNLKLSLTKAITVPSLVQDMVIEMSEGEFEFGKKNCHPFIKLIILSTNDNYLFDVELDLPKKVETIEEVIKPKKNTKRKS